MICYNITIYFYTLILSTLTILNAIDLNNVEFSYSENADKNTLKIKSWQVKQGQQLFMHGPSGSGKSTLLNLICGLTLPNKGDIHLFEQSLNNMSNRQRDKFRASHIGYIFQKFNLIDYLSAVENIKLANYLSPKSTPENFLVQIHKILTSLNLSIKDWNRPVNQLSVGQQQRVGIARALINKPKLIIADEPTSSIDQASRDSFISLLSSMCQQHNSTLLFVSHDMNLRKHFDSSIALTDINTVENLI